MCDYSLHAVATRPAEVGETLVSTKFQMAGTRGFASPDSPRVAVCLRPGTELAFEHDALIGGVMFSKRIGARLARFRQIDTDKPHQHHDALEFSNGTIVLGSRLIKSTIQEQRRGRQRRGSFAPADRIELQCA